MKAIIVFPGRDRNAAYWLKRMKYFIFTLILLNLLAPSAYCRSDDLQSPNISYNQPLTNDLDSPLHKYEDKYSAGTLSNPYGGQFDIQHGPNAVSNPYRVDSPQFRKIEAPPLRPVSGAPQSGKKASAKAKKPSPEEVYLSSLLSKSSPQKTVPLFLPLVILSAFAIAVTIFIIIGIFKK